MTKHHGRRAARPLATGVMGPTTMPKRRRRPMPMSVTAERTQWATRIWAVWQKSVDNIIETGRLLPAAKADPKMQHGEWGTAQPVRRAFAVSRRCARSVPIY